MVHNWAKEHQWKDHTVPRWKEKSGMGWWSGRSEKHAHNGRAFPWPWALANGSGDWSPRDWPPRDWRLLMAAAAARGGSKPLATANCGGGWWR